jgi:hypothetical protein
MSVPVIGILPFRIGVVGKGADLLPFLGKAKRSHLIRELVRGR